MLSIALLPIGLISLYQTRSVVEKAEALTRSAYLGQTVAAAERQSDLIHEGFASARVLGGAILSMEIDLAGCSDLMEGFIRSHPAFALALFVDVNGVSRCNSRGLFVLSSFLLLEVGTSPTSAMTRLATAIMLASASL